MEQKQKKLNILILGKTLNEMKEDQADSFNSFLPRFLRKLQLYTSHALSEYKNIHIYLCDITTKNEEIYKPQLPSTFLGGVNVQYLSIPNCDLSTFGKDDSEGGGGGGDDDFFEEPDEDDDWMDEHDEL